MASATEVADTVCYAMKVMIINNDRYLINTELADHVLDGVCEDILKYYPSDATVEFDDVKPSDIRP